MPLFSVVIPLYNKENHIQQTIQSVLNQDFNDYEIIVINDGSTDSSYKRVEEIQHPKIKLFNYQNQGPSIARNLGIEHSSGKIIAFLDADDYWMPFHLSDLHKLIIEFPEAKFLATGYEFYYNDDKKIIPYFIDLQKDTPQLVQDFFKSSYIYRVATSTSVAVYKEVFDVVGNFDSRISSGQDLDMWIRIALKYKVAMHTRISARYCMQTQNRITLADTKRKTFPLLNNYLKEEKENYWLAKFLDLYRAEYALKVKLANDTEKFKHYYDLLNQKNITLKTRILLNSPVNVLKLMYSIKKRLENSGIFISAYH